ncbi:hypothetical protein [Desertivibrio insolitus]|uniref:hypothetical protein n=1 Tax=Herbiconiux sp. SYSU D00978 TaxID=2812562 RepID=UPI001A959236|nr:hypothetical protein [Herbiconiux sp. SYSU D00978]
MPTQPLPGGFAFEPRKLVANPLAFGKTSRLLPPSPAVSDPEGDPRYAAAMLQHRVVNLVREQLAETGHTLASYIALEPEPVRGLNYSRLVRIQRGETMMQLTDLMHWMATFPAIAPAVAAVVSARGGVRS